MCYNLSDELREIQSLCSIPTRHQALGGSWNFIILIPHLTLYFPLYACIWLYYSLSCDKYLFPFNFAGYE